MKNVIEEYREAFVGSAAVLLRALKVQNPKRVWLNDRNPGVAAYWQAVKMYPVELLTRIVAVDPHDKEGLEVHRQPLIDLAEIDLNDKEAVVTIGAATFVSHQLSYSGFGIVRPVMALEIGCHWLKWCPSRIVRRIMFIHKALAGREVVVTNGDFAPVITNDEHRAHIFLDPPYHCADQSIYRYQFSDGDHRRLATVLESTPHSWLLTYDPCEHIRSLYSWAAVETVRVNYPLRLDTQRDHPEFRISPRRSESEATAPRSYSRRALRHEHKAQAVPATRWAVGSTGGHQVRSQDPQGRHRKRQPGGGRKTSRVEGGVAR